MSVPTESRPAKGKEQDPKHINAIAAIAVIRIALTTTIQLSEETQGKLFQLVARLQSELGRRVSYDEAIAFLIMETQGKQDPREDRLRQVPRIHPARLYSRSAEVRPQDFPGRLLRLRTSERHQRCSRLRQSRKRRQCRARSKPSRIPCGLPRRPRYQMRPLI